MKIREVTIRHSRVKRLNLIGGLAAVVMLAATGFFVTRPTSADTLVTPPDSCFQFSAGTITKYYSYENDDSSSPECPRALTIPSTISGVPVTVIGQPGFQNTDITDVSIPGSVTHIEQNSFAFNQRMTSIIIPNSVTDIGDWAFYQTRLTSVSLSNTLTSIGDYAFYLADLTSLSIPSSVTNIGASAFTGNRLTTLSIPPSVTTIKSSAFSNNQLTQVTIPNGVTHIEDYAFNDNQLSSISLPESIVSIGEAAFSFNNLTDVNLPSSLQSLKSTAFFGQNPLGGLIDSGGANYLYSSNPTTVQGVYDSMRYVQLHTADPLNPHSLINGIVSEAWWSGSDYNANGTQRDSFGGHIINPTSVTLRYINSDGTEIKPTEHAVGMRTNDNLPLNDYSTMSSGILAPIDPINPTPQETDDVQAGFAQYYQVGQNKTFIPTAINGYTTPSTQTKTLVAGDNTITFVYQTPSQASGGNSGGTLPSAPNTGLKPFTVDVPLAIYGGLAFVLLLAVVGRKQLKNRAPS